MLQASTALTEMEPATATPLDGKVYCCLLHIIWKDSLWACNMGRGLRQLPLYESKLACERSERCTPLPPLPPVTLPLL